MTAIEHGIEQLKSMQLSSFFIDMYAEKRLNHLAHMHSLQQLENELTACMNNIEINITSLLSFNTNPIHPQLILLLEKKLSLLKNFHSIIFEEARLVLSGTIEYSRKEVTDKLQKAMDDALLYIDSDYDAIYKMHVVAIHDKVKSIDKDCNTLYGTLSHLLDKLYLRYHPNADQLQLDTIQESHHLFSLLGVPYQNVCNYFKKQSD